MKNWAVVPLRLGIGIMALAHGLQMAFGLFNGSGVGGFAKMLETMGFFMPKFWAVIGAYTLLLGGICLILGFLTRIASLFLAIFMVVAVMSVHISKGFFISNGGYEYNFVIICGCIALMLSGPGALSIGKKN
jgi:putative oxidoreductase